MLCKPADCCIAIRGHRGKAGWKCAGQRDGSGAYPRLERPEKIFASNDVRPRLDRIRVLCASSHRRRVDRNNGEKQQLSAVVVQQTRWTCVHDAQVPLHNPDAPPPPQPLACIDRRRTTTSYLSRPRPANKLASKEFRGLELRIKLLLSENPSRYGHMSTMSATATCDASEMAAEQHSAASRVDQWPRAYLRYFSPASELVLSDEIEFAPIHSNLQSSFHARNTASESGKRKAHSTRRMPAHAKANAAGREEVDDNSICAHPPDSDYALFSSPVAAGMSSGRGEQASTATYVRLGLWRVRLTLSEVRALLDRWS